MFISKNASVVYKQRKRFIECSQWKIIQWKPMKKNIKKTMQKLNVAELVIIRVSMTLFENPRGPVELGNPNICAETKLCLNFILFRLKK